MVENNFSGSPILPVRWKKNSTIADIIEAMGKTCFEATKVAYAAKLYQYMIENKDTIWLGISGAGPAGGMGGYIIDLIENGFVDVICSTGAQVYHDGHFGFGLPVKQGSPHADDNALDEAGITRIYDIYLCQRGTLERQDEIICDFIRTLSPKQPEQSGQPKERSSAEWCHEWGKYLHEKAPHPERSWVAAAAKYKVPLFLDSESNHSLGMNISKMRMLEGIDTNMHPSLSLEEGAGIAYCNSPLVFFEWGGGGPKNWIQTLGPLIKQIYGIEFEGADRGIQITTAPEHDGGLSGCTFGEAVTWGKYTCEI